MDTPIFTQSTIRGMAPLLMIGVVLVTGAVAILVTLSMPNSMDQFLALLSGGTVGILSAAVVTILVSLLAGITDPKVGDHFKQSCVLYLLALGGVVMMILNYYSISSLGKSGFAVFLFWTGLFSGLTLLGNALGLSLIGLCKEARSNRTLQRTLVYEVEPGDSRTSHAQKYRLTRR